MPAKSSMSIPELPTQSIVLAAGRGERLRPLTDRLPKPLVSVGGQPLLDHHLQRLRQAGVTHCVINIAHLGALIEAHVGDGARYNLQISFSREPPGALETGGGIKSALPLLRDRPFIVINADIFCDFEFANLRCCASSLAHLVLVENPPHHPHGDFGLSGEQVTNDLVPRYTFSGIAVYDPKFFEITPTTARFPLAPLLRQGAANGLVSGQLFRGRWFDIGTATRLAAARMSDSNQL
jgi:N-acetyl-alpha-D-muramate 1-phosphate uridylyltransferase